MRELKVAVYLRPWLPPSQVSLDKRTGRLVTEGAGWVLNPNDRRLLGAAVKIRESHGATLTGLVVGPPKEVEELSKEALASGLEEVYSLADPNLENLDSLTVGLVLGEMIRKLGGFDVTLLAEEGGVGPILGGVMDLPVVSRVTELGFEGGLLTLEQRWEDTYRLVEVKPPAILTLNPQSNFPPAYPTPRGIRAAFEGGVKPISLKEGGVGGSKTRIREMALAEEPSGLRLTEPPQEAALRLKGAVERHLKGAG